MKHGLTLTSLMVAVALSGVLAVAGTRLVVNQMNTLRIMELRDKGDSIFQFYSNLLHDNKVWWCTLYDNVLEGNATPTNNPNHRLRLCVLKGENCDDSGTAMRLMGPDCRFTKEKHGYVFNLCTQGNISTRFDVHGKYRFRDRCLQAIGKKSYVNSRVTLIPVGGKDLKDSAVQTVSGGWWNVKVTWEHKGNSAVDIILTQTFNKDRWRGASVGKRYLPELKRERVLKVRRSANQVYQPPSDDPVNDPSYAYAVTGIALHSAGRTEVRHTTKTVLTGFGVTSDGNQSYCHDSPWGFKKYGPVVHGNRSLLADWGDLKGGVVQSTLGCSSLESGRVSVTPKDCGRQSSVIAQIGVGSGITTASDNVRCALDGQGKMVQYSSTCHGGRVTQFDSCTVNGQTFYSYKWPVPTALARVTAGGRARCVGLPSWPARNQGPRGRKGYAGRGPQGLPGPAWNSSRCACRTSQCRYWD